jgi:hypothetical protein
VTVAVCGIARGHMAEDPSGCSNKLVGPAHFALRPVVRASSVLSVSMCQHSCYIHTQLTAVPLLHFFELESVDFDDGNCGHYLDTAQFGRHLPTFRRNLKAHQIGDLVSSKMSLNTRLNGVSCKYRSRCTVQGSGMN